MAGNPRLITAQILDPVVATFCLKINHRALIKAAEIYSLQMLSSSCHWNLLLDSRGADASHFELSRAPHSAFGAVALPSSAASRNLRELKWLTGRRKYRRVGIFYLNVAVDQGMLLRVMKDTLSPAVRASISFPPTLYETLEDIAKQKKVSLAWVVRDAAERYVAEQPLTKRQG